MAKKKSKKKTSKKTVKKKAVKKTSAKKANLEDGASPSMMRKILLRKTNRVFHNDEKWFFSLVIRQFNKCVPFFGCYPVNHSVHHKSHIGKVLALVTTAFAPFNNDFQQGGRAFKVGCQCAGGMVEAKNIGEIEMYFVEKAYQN